MGSAGTLWTAGIATRMSAELEPQSAGLGSSRRRANTLPCNLCGRRKLDASELTRPDTGERLFSCVHCIESVMQMKASREDRRSCRILEHYAREYDWQVWTAPQVVYLLPSTPAASRDVNAVADVDLT
jgi:hypothetical protein